jgi:RNA polymerase sigma-70 factor (ECF subfamily)
LELGSRQPVTYPSSAPDTAVESAAIEGLVRRAQTKDAAAFAELIGRYERMALSIAYSVLGEAAAAGDAVQEAFIRAWERLGGLKDPARFGSWLSGVVRNGAIDAKRRGRLQPRSMQADPSQAQALAVNERWTADPLDELSRRERHDTLESALAELDDVTRSAVVLRYYDNKSSKEIGDLLDLAPTAVDMRLSRARQQLRRKLSATGVFADKSLE